MALSTILLFFLLILNDLLKLISIIDIRLKPKSFSYQYIRAVSGKNYIKFIDFSKWLRNGKMITFFLINPWCSNKLNYFLKPMMFESIGGKIK